MSCPHPTFLAELLPDSGPTSRNYMSDCEWAKQLRGKLFGCLDNAACCKESPKSIEDETYDHPGHIKMIRQLIDWTYDLCERENSVYMGVYSPRSCRPRKGDCC